MASGIAAIGGRNFQSEVVVEMTGRAGHVCVTVGQQKAGSAVIEFSIRPCGDGVAGGAGRSRRWEPCRDVIGNIAADGLRLVPVGGVAGLAFRPSVRRRKPGTSAGARAGS